MEDSTLEFIIDMVHSLFRTTTANDAEVEKALDTGKRLNGDQCYNLHKLYLQAKKSEKIESAFQSVEEWATIGFYEGRRIVALRINGYLYPTGVLFEDLPIAWERNWRTLRSNKKVPAVLYLREYTSHPGDLTFVYMVRQAKPVGVSQNISVPKLKNG